MAGPNPGGVSEDGAYHFSFKVAICGDTGVGKTTLLSNLLHKPVEWEDNGRRTLGIRQRTLELRLEGDDGHAAGVPFRATLIDSPGWGDTLSLRRSFGVVTRHLDGAYSRALRAAFSATDCHRQMDAANAYTASLTKFSCRAPPPGLDRYTLLLTVTPSY